MPLATSPRDCAAATSRAFPDGAAGDRTGVAVHEVLRGGPLTERGCRELPLAVRPDLDREPLGVDAIEVDGADPGLHPGSEEDQVAGDRRRQRRVVADLAVGNGADIRLANPFLGSRCVATHGVGLEIDPVGMPLRRVEVHDTCQDVTPLAGEGCAGSRRGRGRCGAGRSLRGGTAAGSRQESRADEQCEQAQPARGNLRTLPGRRSHSLAKTNLATASTTIWRVSFWKGSVATAGTGIEESGCGP